MGVKFGEIDSSQILDNEFRILVLERVVDHLLTSNPTGALGLDIQNIRKDVLEVMKKKYPNSGIELKG
ncbi:hypothetical protein [Algiphilus aromaticivorans]|uniref:hypothetical protein n=1 Tax=Algiphilus aromaticivorans TaxID=382454 RepID=UPI0005C134E2|nr:hypothetical protein [Algiphilus aromaticivorans]